MNQSRAFEKFWKRYVDWYGNILFTVGMSALRYAAEITPEKDKCSGVYLINSIKFTSILIVSLRFSVHSVTSRNRG